MLKRTYGGVLQIKIWYVTTDHARQKMELLKYVVKVDILEKELSSSNFQQVLDQTKIKSKFVNPLIFRETPWNEPLNFLVQLKYRGHPHFFP